MKLIRTQESKLDRVTKNTFATAAGDVEFSCIRHPNKDCICVPTQTTCAQGCAFCYLTHTRKGAAPVNMNALQMLVGIEASIPDDPHEELLVAFMGAGEPFENLAEVITAIEFGGAYHTNARFSLATSVPRTCDLRACFGRLRLGRPVKVHYSLHSADPAIRRRLMPKAHEDFAGIVSTYLRPADEIHYAPIAGINDGMQHAEQLSDVVKGKCTIKLMTFNPHPCNRYAPSQDTARLAGWLRDMGERVEIYRPPGADIGASCGQFEVRS